MKVAVIGHGMVAGAHLRALCDAGFAPPGILGREPARAQAFLDGLGMSGQVYADLDWLIQDRPDFAILTTPPNARLPYVQALVGAQIPILMEKPIERSLAAAEQIVTLCEEAQVPLGVVFQHRMRAPVQHLRQVIEDGALGDLGLVEITVPWWRDQAYYDIPGRGTYDRDGGGVMINQAIHSLDLALSLAGPVRTLQAALATTPLHKLEAEDTAIALLSFDTGAIGVLTATTAAYPGGAEAVAFYGSQGTARLEGAQLRVTWRDGRVDEVGEATGTGGGADPMAFPHAWHQAVIEDFAQALRAGRPPAITGRSALAAHQVIDAMQRSAADTPATPLGSQKDTP